MRGLPLCRDCRRGRAAGCARTPPAGDGRWCRPLDGAPAQIIAEIVSSIARRPRIDAGAERGAQQPQRVRAKPHRIRTGADRSLADARLRRIGPQQRDGIACTGLDADMRCAAGEAEHQQRLRTMLCQCLRQFAVDRLVGHGKDMAGSSTSEKAGRRSRSNRFTSACVGL